MIYGGLNSLIPSGFFKNPEGRVFGQKDKTPHLFPAKPVLPFEDEPVDVVERASYVPLSEQVCAPERGDDDEHGDTSFLDPVFFPSLFDEGDILDELGDDVEYEAAHIGEELDQFLPQMASPVRIRTLVSSTQSTMHHRTVWTPEGETKVKARFIESHGVHGRKGGRARREERRAVLLMKGL